MDWPARERDNPQPRSETDLDPECEGVGLAVIGCEVNLYNTVVAENYKYAEYDAPMVTDDIFVSDDSSLGGYHSLSSFTAWNNNSGDACISEWNSLFCNLGYEGVLAGFDQTVYENLQEMFNGGQGIAAPENLLPVASLFQLMPTSEAINAGNNQYVDGLNSDFPEIENDYRGKIRIYGPFVDIGAFENCSLVVTKSYDDGTGEVEHTLSWALDNASDGAEIIFELENGSDTITFGGTAVDGVCYTIDHSVTLDASDVPGGITVTGDGIGTVFSVVSGKTVEISNFTVTNDGKGTGDGIVNAGELTLDHVIVTGSNGNGVVNDGSLSMINVLVDGNAQAGVVSGSSVSTELNLYNTTIAGNGTGISVVSGTSEDGDTVNLYNTIVANNNTADIAKSSGAVVNGYYSLSTFDDWSNGGESCYHLTDPAEILFADAEHGDYHLTGDYQKVIDEVLSAVDTGNNDYISGKNGFPEIVRDLDGRERVIRYTVDMGAYEYIPAITVLHNYDYGSDPGDYAGHYEADGVTPAEYENTLSWAIDVANELGAAVITFDLQNDDGEIETRVANKITYYANSKKYYEYEGAYDARFSMCYNVVSDTTIDATGVDGTVVIDGNRIFSDDEGGSDDTRGAVFYIGNENYDLPTYKVRMMNLTVTGGRSDLRGGGGGIMVDSNAELEMYSCAVTNNAAKDTSLDIKGGGICAYETVLTLVDCDISNNEISSCSASGGGVSCDGELIMRGCTVSGNKVYSEGYHYYSGDSGGDARGGGVALRGRGEISSCSITDNTVTALDRGDSCGEARGGGAYIFGECTITSSTIANNEAVASLVVGGGVISDGSPETDFNPAGIGMLVVYNSLISGNQTTVSESAVLGAGGGVAAVSPVTLVNCTVADNAVSVDSEATPISDPALCGGGVGVALVHDSYWGDDYNLPAPEIVLMNTIVADNNVGGTLSDIGYEENDKGIDLNQVHGYNTLITSSFDWFNGNGDGDCCVTVNVADPLFMDAASGDYRLAPGSRAVDAGKNTYIAGIDQDLPGNPRIANKIVDMGAFETPCFTVTESTDDGTGAENTLSWALEQSEDYDYSIIAFEGVDTVTAEDGVTYTVTSSVTIDASTSENGGVTIVGSGDGSVFTVGDDDLFADPVWAEMKNLTITGGEAESGGGVRVVGADDSLILINVLVAGNRASANGSGIANSGTLTLVNVTVAGNTSTGETDGGAVYLAGGTVTNVYNTIIAQNFAGNSVGTDINAAGADTDVNGYYTLAGFSGWTNNGGESCWSDTTGDIFRGVKGVNWREENVPFDYHLAWNSKAHDVGNNDYVNDRGVTTDREGRDRVIEAAVDLGAFENPRLIVTQITDNGDGDVENSLSWVIDIVMNSHPDILPANASVKFDLVEGDTVAMAKQITLDKPVLIDASDHDENIVLTVDETMTDRFFNITGGTSGSRVTFKNITMSGANYSSHGAAVMVTSSACAEFDDVVFSGNTSARNGGALGNQGDVIIVGGAFSDNCAVSSTRATNGGAIFNSGTITISGGTVFSGNFISSTAPGNGGAIDNIAGGTINLSGVVFSGNSAVGSNDLVWNGTNDQGCGGAIQNWGTMTVTGCTFDEGNQAYNGGAIANGAGASMQVIGSEFSGNTALFGGAIVNGGTLSVTGASSFTGNVLVVDETTGAAGCGGAIDNLEGGVLTITGVSGAEILFSGNTAPIDTEGESDKSMGGAVQNWGDATLTYCVFTGNTAYNGGAIANGPYTAANGTAPAFGTMVLNNITVGTESNGNTAVYGGGIFNAGDLSLNDVAVSYNTASRNAGGISNATVTLHDQSATVSGSLTFASGSIDITNNSAANCGGGILSNQGTEIIFGSGFTGTVNATDNTLGNSDVSQDRRGVDGIFQEFSVELQAEILANFSGDSEIVFYPIAASSPVPLALLIKPVYTTSYVTIDLDGDRFVGPGDYALISAHWFSVAGDDDWNPACDLDGDGFVGPGDLALLSANWFDETETAEVVHRSVIEQVFEVPEELENLDGGLF